MKNAEYSLRHFRHAQGRQAQAGEVTSKECQLPGALCLNSIQHSAFIIQHFLLILALSLSGCKFKPSNNMEEQPSYKPYEQAAQFLDGTEARPLPPGTVARAGADASGHPWADARATLPADTTVISLNQSIPFLVTREVLERGQERFTIYCSVCHGRLGNGDGMIVHRGLTPPPSFHIQRLRELSDAHYYNVISNGFGAMFSYNDRVRPEDRWMIVAYIRALQASTASASSEDLRAMKLEGTRP